MLECIDKKIENALNDKDIVNIMNHGKKAICKSTRPRRYLHL